MHIGKVIVPDITNIKNYKIKIKIKTPYRIVRQSINLWIDKIQNL